MVVLDTDHLTLMQEEESAAKAILRTRLKAIDPTEVATTIIPPARKKVILQARSARECVAGSRRNSLAGASGSYEVLSRRGDITYEEPVRGWLARTARAKTRAQMIAAYGRLKRHLGDDQSYLVLDFDASAVTEFERLRRERIRIGSMDLKIAALATVHDATLLTRNLVDFRKVRGLKAEDWTIGMFMEASPQPQPKPMKPVPKPPPPQIVIVGGGLAGLAVASRLIDRGLGITLLESRPRLGGRASSFADPATGELVDNCQHVSMACCTNLADFCQRVGIDPMLRREPELVFLGPEGRVSRFRAGLAPAPFHLAGSFLAARFLGLGDKLRVAQGLACLAWSRDDRPGESFADWLGRHGQSLRAINLFWGAVLVSALNERLDRMDVGHARKVFLDGFLRNRTGFQLELPLVPLGELYGTRLETWLRDQGVAVRLTTGVRAVEPDEDGAIGGVVLRSGERLPADFVVLAVPFDRVRSLIPATLRDSLPALAHLDAMSASPITGVHFWFDRPVCPFDHVVTPGRLIQWVFNHTAIQGRTAPAGAGQYLQVVISASYDLLAFDTRAIRDLVLADLAQLWPAAGTAQLLRWWVVTEHGATFAVRPGVEALRPAQRTPIDGLFLAGDWTDTGWPATMEGAVRSGYLAAQEILTVLDRPTRLIRSGLRAGALARWLFGAAEYRPPRPAVPPTPAVAARPSTSIPQPCPIPTDGR